MTSGDPDRRSPSPPPSPIPHRKAVRGLFIGVMVWLCFQYLIVSRLGEPYPAVMMPRFAGAVTDSGGHIHARSADAEVVFQDGTATLVSTDSLLSLAPVSHREAILYFAFGPRDPSPPAPTASPSAVERLKRIVFPGLVNKYALMNRPRADPRTVRWLKQRLEALFPSRNARAVSFLWYDEDYLLTSTPPQRSRRLVGRFDVQLDDAR